MFRLLHATDCCIVHIILFISYHYHFDTTSNVSQFHVACRLPFTAITHYATIVSVPEVGGGLIKIVLPHVVLIFDTQPGT